MGRSAVFALLCACSFQTHPADDAGLSTGGGEGGAAIDWWSPDFAYRAPITVATTTAATDAAYTVVFTADTGALVTANKALASGNDWRIVRHTGDGQWTELDRWVDDARGSGWNSADTRTWFSLPVALAANATDGETYVYYGSPNAAAPPSDLDQVFLFGDDFETGLTKWTANNLGEQIAIDNTQHAGGAGSFHIQTKGGAGAGIHRDISLPAVPMLFSAFLRQAQTNQSFSAARSFDVPFSGRTPPTFVDSHLRLATELDSSDKMQIWTNPLDNWSPAVPKNEWHEVDTQWDGATNTVRGSYDGSPWHTPTNLNTYDYQQGTPSQSIGLEGEGGQDGGFWVDDYTIRRFVDPEPTATLGAEQPLPR